MAAAPPSTPAMPSAVATGVISNQLRSADMSAAEFPAVAAEVSGLSRWNEGYQSQCCAERSQCADVLFHLNLDVFRASFSGAEFALAGPSAWATQPFEEGCGSQLCGLGGSEGPRSARATSRQ